MMKIQQSMKMGLTLIGVVSALFVSAQEDLIYLMNPSEFTPNPDSGYFVTGTWRDLDGDKKNEFYNECFDAYGDADHKEVGEQNGWIYSGVIIFRGCDVAEEVVDDVIKGLPREEDRAEWPKSGDIIQLGKSKNVFVDTLETQVNYIASPSFSNLKTVTVKVSTDVSINDSRKVYFLLEASLDGGETWEFVDNIAGEAWLIQEIKTQGGESHTYAKGGGNDRFEKIVAASEGGPIKIRVASSGPESNPVNGQRLKIWEIRIEAQTAVTALSNVENVNLEPFLIQNGHFISVDNENLFIYNLSGVLLGSGLNVPITRKGLYIVTTDKGFSKKVLIK